jgi:hypothetical protein
MSILIHFACFFRGNRRKPRVFLPFQGFSSFMPCFLRHTCTRRVVTFETEGEPELPGQCIASDAKIDQFLSSSFWKMGTTGPLDRYPQASSVSPGYFEWCEFLKAGVFGDVPSQPRHIQIIQGILYSFYYMLLLCLLDLLYLIKSYLYPVISSMVFLPT